MAEDSKNRTATIAVITGVVALFLGLCLGAVFGGLGGYLLARSSTTGLLPSEFPANIIPVPTQRSQRTVVPTPRSVLPAIPTPERLRPSMIPSGGALIQQVVDGSPAAGAGLRRNEVITKVDGAAVDPQHHLADLLARYKPGDTVTLDVWRAGTTRTIKVTLGQHPDDAQRAYLGVQYTEIDAQQPTPQPGD